jgi:hypothetical protein
MDYIAPTRSIAFTLDSVADLGDQSDGAETGESILNEAGAFASEVLGPLNR